MKHKDALQFMRNSEEFSLEYRSFNKKRKTGGKLVEIHSARLVTGKLEREGALKPTNHKTNFTFDIEVIVAGQRTNNIKRVHLIFVTKIDGKNCYP